MQKNEPSQPSAIKFRQEPNFTPREVTTLTGHTNQVNALVALPNGQLASGSLDETIKLWNVNTGECETTLTGHTDCVLALVVLPNGQLASASRDNTIKLWNVNTGTCETTLTGHTSCWVCALVALPNGQLASGTDDRTIKLWNVNTGQCQTTLTGHTTSVNTLVVLPTGQLASGSSDKRIKLWNVNTGKCEKTLTGHTSDVFALAALPNGQLASGSKDKIIKLWNVSTGKCKSTLTGHTNTVTALVALPNGQLASGSRDKTIKLWNVNTGKCESTLTGHTKVVYSFTLLPNGQLASGYSDGTIKIWGLGLCPILAANNAADSEVNASVEKFEKVKIAPAMVPINSAEAARKEAEKQTQERQLREAKEAAERLKAEQAKKAQEEAARKDKLPPVLSPRPKSAAKTISTTVSQSTTSSQMVPLPDIHADRFPVSELGAFPMIFIAEEKISLGRELGKGGFGTVYEAKYNFQTVAVKRYEGTHLPERVAQEVRHEVSIMLRIQHECLVRFLGLVQIASHPAMLVMEYGANGSLYNHLHSTAEIPWTLRLRIAEELARGLAYLHQEKIVHRDIKSLNVVLDRDFHAKWCDFGLAVLKLHSTTTTQQSTEGVGTLRWMAPDLFSRKTSAPSTASDIWALGMVFFELASREVPFKDAQTTEQVKDFIKEATGEEVPEECLERCPGLGAIMQRCWAERAQRPTAVQLAEETAVLLNAYVEPTTADNRNTKSVISGPLNQTPTFNPFHR